MPNGCDPSCILKCVSCLPLLEAFAEDLPSHLCREEPLARIRSDPKQLFGEAPSDLVNEMAE